MTMDSPITLHVNAKCPMGCGDTMVATAGPVGPARVVCEAPDCPDPDRLHKLVTDERMDQHVVVVRETGFAITHPLLEREDDMTECSLHKWMHSLAGPPVPPGKYVASTEDTIAGEWGFEPIT